MANKVDITFIDKDGTISIPISSCNVPEIGHRVQLHTGPASSALPDGSAIGRSLETWKVLNVTWDSWLAAATIEVRRCR